MKSYLALIVVAFASTAFAPQALMLTRSHGQTHKDHSTSAPEKEHVRPDSTHHDKRTTSPGDDTAPKCDIELPVLDGQPSSEPMDSDDGVGDWVIETPTDRFSRQRAILVIPDVSAYYAPVIDGPT